MSHELAAIRKLARLLDKGRCFEDFEVDQVFEHHWGRTLTEADSVLFTTLTLSYNPVYFNAETAREHGHKQLVVHPNLLFLAVFGLSVEDLSENGGPFLGVEQLTFHRPVLVGETVRGRSRVRTVRRSDSHPGMGIVGWHTEGLVGDEVVVDFVRTNFVRTADAPSVL
ncbi:MaoC/PaaZ C-terminal domain-containing protein [Actinacidiphila sp. DG2A-62]|uniref:MaoC/PaaZ C-terminal domain-containing protein n=1 Tax=Actinacidiphila sp. DG2A-62 TaxID=3108821 RepID=UPI002DB5824A|nr:MaoC/PaaZ C-terminal domain-containing protein [Actinacidiphila sp. DG2A-62]MEC3993743.1 MaoC/PaaZ C-terminal domain-containing protein [Actinacidiphila sp. DG2A-62]